jgi:transcriptional regulator with XRE-family HTH domain
MAEPNVLGERLKQVRTARNLTIKQVGDAIGCHFATVSTIERTGTTSLDLLRKLADLYGVSVDWLMGRTEDKPETLADQKFHELLSLLAVANRISPQNLVTLRTLAEALAAEHEKKQE